MNKLKPHILPFAAAAVLLLAILSGAAGYRIGTSCGDSSIRCVASTDDALRARLLAEAMDYVGVCNPEVAADVWARGLMRRSAAL